MSSHRNYHTYNRTNRNDNAFIPNNNKKKNEEEERDTGMIPFPPMFNCASNNDDPFTQDPSTSPYDDTMMMMEDDLIPKTAFHRTESTSGISLHETEHILGDGTKVVRTETVDQAGFVLKVNETRTPPPVVVNKAESSIFPSFSSPKKSSPSSSPSVPSPPPKSSSSSSPMEEKKEDTAFHLTFTPSFDDVDLNTNNNTTNKDPETGNSRDPQTETNKTSEEDEEKVCGLSKRVFLLIILVILLLIAAIVAGVLASSSEASRLEDDDPLPPPPTKTPISIILATPAPTIAPIVTQVPTKIAALGQILLPEENLETLSIFSASYRALSWLLDDDDAPKNLGISLEQDSQPLRERFAIASLYFGTNGKGWINNDRWMTSVTVCNWEGVSCKGGNVTSLVFNANRLEGQLPTTLGKLSWLENLYIPQNALTGTLSSELGSLTNLEILNIYSNSIGGTVPTELGILKNMVELVLWQNDLTGSLPKELGRLTKLEKLDVAQNEFVGGIPTQLGNLRALRKMFLDGNSLIGSIPTELGNLELLELLHLPNNRLTGRVPSELQNAPNLLDVKLNSNFIDGGLETLFCDRTMTSFYSNCAGGGLPCPCCTHCCVRNGGCMEMTFTLAPTMAPTSRLGTFADILIGPDKDKQNAILSDTNSPQYKALTWINEEDYPADDAIEDSPNLQERYGLAVLYYATGGDTSWSGGASWLSPGYDQCDWEFVACIASQVRYLTLDNNNLVGTIPAEIAKISNLRSLEISNNPGMIPSPIPTQMGELRFLSNLSLDSIRLTGTIPTELMRLQFLTTLKLAQNDLTGNIPSRIQQLFNLKFLNLRSNALDGGLPTEMATLRLLRTVELQENSLSGSIPIEWGAQILSPIPSIGLIPSFEFLEKLRLDQNNLTGNLPIQIGELKAMRELHLHGNGFSGVLPTQLMDLPVLQYLRVSSNQLRGTLHTYIGNLRKLSYFDIQENNFSGTVPTEFGSLTSLTSLSLAFNPLVGEIPTTFGNLIRMDKMFVQGTNLVGGLESVFCDRRLSLYFADCLPDNENNTDIACACCNYCCNAAGMECTPVQV